MNAGDTELLQEFARSRSQAAFAELVRRHLDLVYSAALRQVGGDAHLAGDVAQQVFVDLARKAPGLATHASLAGWLYKSAHYAASNLVRAERRRRKYEEEAQAMHLIDHDTAGEADWTKLRPVLDEAMLALDEPDRDAVLRRYFSTQSFGEIAAVLGVSEDGARKRVERALDQLHGLLARRGITSGAGALALALSRHAVQAAPAQLPGLVTASAIGGVATSMVGGASLLLMKKLLLGLATVLAMGLLALSVVEYRTRNDLQAEVTSLRRRTAEADRARAAARRETEVSRAAAAAGLAAEPVGAEEKSWIDAAGGIDQHYALLFRRLRLPREKIDAFKGLLVRRERAVGRMHARMEAQGVAEDSLSMSEWHELQKLAARDVDEEIRAFLGPDAFAYFAEYQRTTVGRTLMKDCIETLAASPEPLTDDQVDLIATWIYDDIDFLTAFPVISENAIARAVAILTPLQLESLRETQLGRAAMNRIFVLNREGAEAGRLTLNDESKRAFARYQTERKTRSQR